MSSHRDAGPLIYVAGRATGLVMAAIAVIILPALLGESGYGRYSYWFGLITVYCIVFDFGTQAMLRRYLPELRQLRQSRALAVRALWLKLIPLSLLGILVAIDAHPLMSVMIFAAGLMASLATNFADVSYAYERMGLHSITVLSRRVLRLILVPVGYLVWGLEGILVALVTAEAIGLVTAIPSAHLLSLHDRALDASFMQYYRLGLWIFAAAMIGTLLGRLPVFAAQWSELSSDAVGRIAICVDLTFFALKELINAVSEAILPRLVMHNAVGRADRYRALITLNLRIISIAGLCIVAVGTGLAGGFLALLGHGFETATPLLQLLLPMVLIAAWGHIYNQLLLVAGKGGQIVLNNAAGLVLAALVVSVNWPRPSEFQLVIALVSGCCAVTATAYFQARALVGRIATPPGLTRLIPVAILVMALLVAWAPQGIVALSLAGICGGLLYLGGIILTCGLTPDDFALFRRATVGR